MLLQSAADPIRLLRRCKAHASAGLVRAHVSRHQHQGIAEIHRPARGIGQPAVVHKLQEDGTHLGMGLVDLVEQHQRIGFSAHPLRQRPALVIAHIARRRADQTGRRVRLGGARKPRSAPPHRVRHGLHRRALPDHEAGKGILQMIQRPVLPLRRHRDPRPGEDGICHIPGAHRMRRLPVIQGSDPLLQSQRLGKILPGNGPLQFLIQPGLCAAPGGAPAGVGRRLIQQIQGLVRQEIAAEISRRHADRRRNGILADFQTVMLFQTRTQSPQDLQGLRLAGLFHPDAAEPPLQSGVLLDALSVFLLGGGPDNLNPPPPQGRLEDVCGVDGPLCRPRSHQHVHLVDEEDDVSRLFDFRKQIPHPLFKFAAVFCPRHQHGGVEAVEQLAPQGWRHLLRGHAPGQTLHDGGLPHAGIAHQGGIVLMLPAEHLDDLLDFRLPSDDRI